MLRLPSRFRRLDSILADLPIEDPLLLTELDGYLTAIAVCPDVTLPAEWLPPIWGGAYGESAPFEDPIDAQLFADMMIARLEEIVRDLGRGRHRPLFDVDPRNGEILWEEWIDGFAMAMPLRPESWATLAAGENAEAATALAGLQTLIDVAGDTTDLTSPEVNALSAEAAALIPGHIAKLYGDRTAPSAPALAQRPATPGRNDACPCGSGNKYKRCCMPS